MNRWAALGISIPLFALALGVDQFMETDKPALLVQLGISFVVMLVGAYVAFSAGTALLYSDGKSEQNLPIQAPSLEVERDEKLLAANRYTYNAESDWWQRSYDSERAPFSETEVIIYGENGQWLLSGSVFVVLNECAWVSKSAKRFEYLNGSGCSLETLLIHTKYQQRLARSEHLIFVGMESYDNSPQRAEDDCHHEWLSECRADELAHRTRNSVPEQWPLNIEFWELDIGASTNQNPAQEFDQRRAIILGIRDRKSGIPVEFAIKMIAERTPVNEVHLKDYSKLSTSNAILIEWEDAEGEQPFSHK